MYFFRSKSIDNTQDKELRSNINKLKASNYDLLKSKKDKKQTVKKIKELRNQLS